MIDKYNFEENIKKMKKRLHHLNKGLLILLFLIATNFAIAQQTLELSIEEAQQTALEHNYSLKTARMDYEIAKLGKWETITSSLPQLSGSASINDNLKLMTQLLPGEMFGQPGEYIEIQFGTKYNSSWGFTASQLIFSAPLYVGIKSQAVLQELSAKNIEKTTLDVKQTVINTYYLILVSEESMRIIEDNLVNINKIMEQTEAMYKAGLMEKTNVDQLKITVAMLENTKKSMERNLELNYNMMRLQLGVDMNTELRLKENLDDLIVEIAAFTMQEENFSLETNIDYQMMQKQKELAELSHRKELLDVLPTISGFYAYNKSGQGDEFNNQNWYPNSMIGLQLNIPLFNSGQNYLQLRKAKIEIEKVETNIEMMKDNLYLQEKQLRFNLNNAMEKYLLQKENIEVAKRLLQSYQLKYESGIISGLELTQSNNDYLEAQSNYISALMELFQAKTNLDKLLNKL
jgi:outer membrane protein TolC